MVSQIESDPITFIAGDVEIRLSRREIRVIREGTVGQVLWRNPLLGERPIDLLKETRVIEVQGDACVWLVPDRRVRGGLPVLDHVEVIDADGHFEVRGFHKGALEVERAA